MFCKDNLSIKRGCMAFIEIPGMTAKMYVPDEELDPKRNIRKKHDCPDCLFCRWCGNDRCAICLKSRSCLKKTGGSP